MGIETQFKKVFLEIENLDKKIEQKEWSLLFEERELSFDNLMKSPNYFKIYNFTREIGDDIINNCTQGKISDDESKIYQQQRYNIDYELHRMNLKIEELDRTFWKSIKPILEEFQNKIMLNLPKNPQKPRWKGVAKIFSRLLAKKPKYLKEE